MNFNKLLLTAMLAAVDAGEAILEIYRSDFNVDFKDDRSPLTLADRRSHEIIVSALKGIQMGADDSFFPVLSEEGQEIDYNQRKRWRYYWLIDPLDGTKEFIKRNGEFTVNVALMGNNQPVVGVIYAPVKDILYFAARQLGSYKLEGGKLITSSTTSGEDYGGNLKNILDRSTRLTDNCSSTKPQIQIAVVGSRSHSSKDVDGFVDRLKTKYKEVNMISAGSSLKFCLVAEGSAQIYPRFGHTMECDTAAGQIIVEGSGGRVIDMETNPPLCYNKTSLLNPYFFAVGNMKYASLFKVGN